MSKVSVATLPSVIAAASPYSTPDGRVVAVTDDGYKQEEEEQAAAADMHVDGHSTSQSTPAALSLGSFSSTPPTDDLIRPPANDEEEEEEDEDEEDEDDEDDTNHRFVSCDSVRRKINMYLATKEMTQTQFRLECGRLTPGSFLRFMRQQGPLKGLHSRTYWNAMNFFKRRDKAKAAEKKAQAAAQQEVQKAGKHAAQETGTSTSSQADPAASTTPAAGAPPTKKARTTAVPSSTASAVTAASEYLPPEAITAPPLWDAPVFDDCDEVRRKLAQCIQSPGMSQVKIAKYIGVTGAAISKFLSRHGKDVGAGLDVYPRAYRYFERLRVMRNEPKSSHRKRNESKLPPSGFPLVSPSKRKVYVLTRRIPATI